MCIMDNSTLFIHIMYILVCTTCIVNYCIPVVLFNKVLADFMKFVRHYDHMHELANFELR